MITTAEEVAKARKEMEEAYSKFIKIKPLYLEAENLWMEKCKIFRDLDYKLALTDGRYHVITSKKERKITADELTLQEITEVAKALNIDLNEPEEEEDDIQTIIYREDLSTSEEAKYVIEEPI